MDHAIEAVCFRISTKEYRLALTAPAIRLFEEKTGKGIFQANVPGSLTESVTLLWAAARGHSPHLTLDALFELVSPADLPKIAEALGECFQRAFRTGEEKERKEGEPGPLGS